MIKFTLRIPIYEEKVLVMCGCDYNVVHDYCHRKYQIDIGANGRHTSELLRLCSGNRLEYILWVEHVWDLRGIIHEVDHLAIHILTDRSIKISKKNSEPHAYLQDYICGKIIDKIGFKCTYEEDSNDE